MPQKVWSIQVPIGTGCAELLNLWIKPWLGTKCVKCGRERYGEANRLEVEWDEGSDLICDFVYSLGALVVKTAIADELLERFSGFTKGRIVMPRHPKLMKPAKVTKRTRKRVWLPYRGPKLCELKITEVVDLLPSSTVVIESKCEACGRQTYADFIGY